MRTETDSRIAPSDDLEEEDAATPKQLAAVIEEARRQKKLQNRVDRLSEELGAAQKELNASKTDVLPKLMEAANLEELSLGGGYRVEMWTDVRANIPSSDNRKVENAAELNERGIAYMDKHAPDLVVNLFTATFPKGEMKLFRKFMADIRKRKQPIDCEVKRTVNPQTLSKWVRDQDKMARSVDEETLRVHRKKIAEVMAPKQKDEIG